MGDVLVFQRPAPFASREPVGDYRGCIHIWRHGPREFEIGHESSSGDSWGYFAQFTSAADALAAAHNLNREQCGGRAEIFIPPTVQAILSGGGA